MAAHDGHFLSLTAPTTGANSRLELLSAPANDAQWTLLGPTVRRIHRGADAAPARLAGRADSHPGVDLSVRHLLSLALDGSKPQEIDCAGHDPTATTLVEIVEESERRVCCDHCEQRWPASDLDGTDGGRGSSY